MIKGTVKEGSLPVLKKWLKVASSRGEVHSDSVRVNRHCATYRERIGSSNATNWLR